MTLPPSTPVTWTAGPARHPITLTGHVVSVNRKTAQVRCNGEVYEVELAKLKRDTQAAQLRPSCLLCGRTCNYLNTQYCCRAHYYEAVRIRDANDVFHAIVAHKSANDGASPREFHIVEATGLGRMTVQRAIRRLEKEGRIRCTVRGRWRDIYVPGGRWVYEGGDNARQ